MASSDYFDFIWKVFNFREEKFGIFNEQPQTLLTKYPDKTGYNLYKYLYETDSINSYKIWFISSWSLTDSIVTYVDNYVGVKRGADLDFSYPPNGTKIFGINSNVAFEKANAEIEASIKKNLYNYFEIADVTASAKFKIMQEERDIGNNSNNANKQSTKIN